MDSCGPEEGIREGSAILETEGQHSALQMYFLCRLQRLLRVRSEQEGRFNTEGARLLDRAIYSTYCDCLAMGLSGEAHQLLRRFSVPSANRRHN